jgi:hypothetical protein
MSPELVNSIATITGVLVAVVGAFIFAFWVAMGIWAFNDIRARTHDWLTIVLAVLLVLVFPIVGLILYMMIRPKATLADVYDRALEEEALLREIEETLACPSCGVPVKEGWVYCPTCHSQLQHTCPTCSNLVRNDWAICVFCGAPQPRAGAALAGAATHVGAQPAIGTGPRALPAERSQAETAAQQAARRAGRNPFVRDASSPAPDDLDDNPYRPGRAIEPS